MNPRPSFVSTIEALRCDPPEFSWAHPTDEEADVAFVLEELEKDHGAGADHPDANGHYGVCTSCGELWPCREWQRGEELALLYLGRGADRYAAHAKNVMDQSPRRSA